MARAFLLSALVVLVNAAPAAEKAPPRFTKRPTARKAGDEVRIEFAVDRRTDVAVCIENAQGKIVRHLVAGTLGKNPPPPLKAGSLAQSIEWDGKDDDGKKADGGPFKVRVGLGLGAKYDRILLGGGPADQVVGGNCMAVGPDGTLYLRTFFGGGGPGWGGWKIIAVNRDGGYQKTLLPYPSDFSKEQQEALGAVVMNLDGRPAPLVINIKGQRFLNGGGPRRCGMAVTADGVILMLTGAGIEAMDAKCAMPWGNRLGPRLLAGAGFADGGRKARGGRADIAVSVDGKWAYVCGFQAKAAGRAAVYRVKLPERSPAEPFFGDPNAPGNDETHLGGALRGVATDGKGHLLIADSANNRVVVVAEKDGKFAGSFPAAAPDCLAVDPVTGAVYLTRLAGSNVDLVKLQGWKEPRELAKISVRAEGNRNYPWGMVLDASAKPPVIWMGCERGGLLRIEDRGAKFGDARRLNNPKLGDGSFVDVVVDRFGPDPEVTVRAENRRFFRLNERSGKFSTLHLKVGYIDGGCVVPGPGGVIYASGYPCTLYKFDHNGAPAAWENPTPYPENMQKHRPKNAPPHAMYVPRSMCYMTHTIGVRRDGHIFTLSPGHIGGRPPKMLVEYEPSGKRVGKPIVWKVTDVAVGPKFDPAGNIYIAEHLNPIGEPYPPEVQAAIGPLPGKRPGAYAAWIRTPRYAAGQLYGSIIKFSPKGGMVHWTGVDEGTPGMNPMGRDPFTGQPQLDPDLKKTEVQYYHPYGSVGRVAVTGAEWIRMGISHLEMYACKCNNMRFDVDEFGRVWYPDLGRFRICVLDTNGNDITHFGGYGNADNRGPESKDKKLAQPEIAFAWLTGVGVTDNYAYMGDSMNRRFLRAKLEYAATETCAIR